MRSWFLTETSWNMRRPLKAILEHPGRPKSGTHARAHLCTLNSWSPRPSAIQHHELPKCDASCVCLLRHRLGFLHDDVLVLFPCPLCSKLLLRGPSNNSCLWICSGKTRHRWSIARRMRLERGCKGCFGCMVARDSGGTTSNKSNVSFEQLKWATNKFQDNHIPKRHFKFPTPRHSTNHRTFRSAARVVVIVWPSSIPLRSGCLSNFQLCFEVSRRRCSVSPKFFCVLQTHLFGNLLVQGFVFFQDVPFGVVPTGEVFASPQRCCCHRPCASPSR